MLTNSKIGDKPIEQFLKENNDGKTEKPCRDKAKSGAKKRKAKGNDDAENVEG